MTMTLETINEDFPKFWRSISANGVLDAAMKEWTVSYNASKSLPSQPSALREATKKLVRVVTKFPQFLKEA